MKIFNNNDQMGMLAFSSNENEPKLDTNYEERISQRQKTRPQSILGEHILYLYQFCMAINDNNNVM